MSDRSRAVLKTYFETGDVPTAVQFQDLIDSFLNISDDGNNIWFKKNLTFLDYNDVAATTKTVNAILLPAGFQPVNIIVQQVIPFVSIPTLSLLTNIENDQVAGNYSIPSVNLATVSAPPPGKGGAAAHSAANGVLPSTGGYITVKLTYSTAPAGFLNALTAGSFNIFVQSMKTTF